MKQCNTAEGNPFLMRIYVDPMHGPPSSFRNQAKEAPMETRAAGVQRVYREFVPSHELVQEEGLDTLIIVLPGFKKEQIRVHIDGYGNLRISGERPLADNQWSRFRKDFRVPEDCNISQIRAKFDSGRLHVTLPKFITEAGAKDRPIQVQKPKENQKPKGEPKPSTGKDDVNQKAAPRPSIEPKVVPEKRGEPIGMRKDAEKVGEKEKDQIEEKKGKKKVASDIKHEEGEKGGATTEAPKEETIKHAAPSSGQDRLGKLKLKVGQLALGFYKPRQLVVNVIVAVVVLVGVGLYVTYKLRSPTVEDGH